MMSDAARARAISATKVALPLAALGLLSTLFLFARTVTSDGALPIANVALTERALEEQLTLPRIRGKTEGGTAYDLAAGAARPDADDPRLLSIDALRFKLEGAGGATLYARTGQIDTGRREAVLIGDIAIDTTTGYALRTERLEGSFDRLSLVSPGEVTGQGPVGQIRAGSMRLEEIDGGQRLHFTDGVELLYTPPTP